MNTERLKNQAELIIFAKAPIAGHVKTRLTPYITPNEAAQLHEAFARETMRRHAELSPRLLVDQSNPLWAQIAPPDALGIQADGDLGTRMRHALQYAFKHGAERVLLLGTDSPSLPTEYLIQGFNALDSADLVIGPACDGGYYTIGMTKDASTILAGGVEEEGDIFHNIQWSTSSVLPVTLHRAQNFTIKMLPFWYDVDEMKDLALLHSHDRTLPMDQRPTFSTQIRSLLQLAYKEYVRSVQ